MTQLPNAMAVSCPAIRLILLVSRGRRADNFSAHLASDFFAAGRSTAVSESRDSSCSTFLVGVGRHGKEEGEFAACVGIAIGQGDEIYTAEFRNQRVQKFTPEGRFLGEFPVQPHAGGLAVDAEGNVYVAHWNSNKLAAYSPTGKLIREWGQKGTADGEFQLPGSVAIGPDGLLYVPDQGNSRVQKFTRRRKIRGKVGIAR